ncbi:hypothetical protein JB92DRAFT_2959152 [Gautieria morchelliformis]|nr:hypothetical protein JB92DRAFT_2959152 [Gautieria morchelliformis]
MVTYVVNYVYGRVAHALCYSRVHLYRARSSVVTRTCCHTPLTSGCYTSADSSEIPPASRYCFSVGNGTCPTNHRNW